MPWAWPADAGELWHTTVADMPPNLIASGASICLQARKNAKLAVNEMRIKAEGGVKEMVTEQNAQQCKAPKILYCSRTHSQIQQVASEMLKTTYKGATYVIVACFIHGNVALARLDLPA